MIDITTIQTYPVPPKVSVLTETNSQLTVENSRLKRTLMISGVVAIGIITYFIIKRNYEYKSREKNQIKGY
jgi:hypothetical protein